MEKEQNAILEAIDIIVKKRLKNLGFNYYMDGVVMAVNATNNTYTVLINGKEYNDIPSKHKLIYCINDTVRVLIKNGNWNKKFIDGTSYNTKFLTSTQYNSVDPDGVEYPMISQNDKHLWIGAYQTATRHHRGRTYISSGYNGEEGNETIYVSVPNETNTNATNHKIMHQGNLNDYLLDLIYPVGSIYMSVNNVSPESFLGGTWAVWGEGRTVVGVNVSNSKDTDFGTVEKKAGEKTHTLTTDEIPSHNHSIPELSGSAQSNGKHTHTLTPKGTISTTTSLTGSMWNMVVQEEKLGMTANGVLTAINKDDSGAPYFAGAKFSKDIKDGVSIDVNHKHTFTGTQGTTSENGGHTHTVTTTADTSGNKGGGKSHNNLQPYITCYMWKRTA